MFRSLLVSATLLPLLLSCSHSGDVDREVDFVIVPYHDPNLGYNPATKLIDSCETRDCGSPISVFYNDGTVQHVQTSGSQGRMLAISPNRQHLAISDAYGLHIANNNKITSYEKAEITASVRGISINDTGNFVSVEHIGSREINGKSGFASLIIWRHDDKVEQKTEVIDGDLIDCGNKPRLYSFGDEEDRRTNLYQFNFLNGHFERIGNINNIDNFSPIAYTCQNKDSLIGYGSVNGFLRYATIKDTDSTFQSNEVIYDEIPTPPHQSLSTSSNIVYYSTQSGNIHAYDTKSDAPVNTINIHELIPGSVDIESTTTSLQGRLAFAFTRDLNSNKWTATEIDIENKKTLYSGENTYLNKQYREDQINHLFIFDTASFSNWIRDNR